jgi:type 1 glutamine amidotransferase
MTSQLRAALLVVLVFVGGPSVPSAQTTAKPQNQTPKPEDVQAMMAALPDKAAVKPKQPRKVLVIAKAAGYVHSSIPLATRTVEELGKKTGAWSTTITYDVTGVTQDNLKQYDAIVLTSTTAEFLDDPDDAAATAARRKAVLDFVRGGKGLAGIHAASDTYHRTSVPVEKGADKSGPDSEVGTWPEWNKMMGGYFKWHWNDGQLIHVKVDDPNHPINAPLKGKPDFQIVDETYTFGRNSFSRQNVHVLTSIDYDKMSAADKAKESFPRADHDYALSWIRREGKGRVFYEAHGHNEKVYAITPWLERVMRGIQYVLGDLPAEDSPSAKGATK